MESKYSYGLEKNASEVEKKLAVKSAQVSQSYDYHGIMMTS